MLPSTSEKDDFPKRGVVRFVAFVMKQTLLAEMILHEASPACQVLLKPKTRQGGIAKTS